MAVLTSTHNLCFGSEIRKIGIPCKPQYFYIKLGLKGYTLHGHIFLMLLDTKKCISISCNIPSKLKILVIDGSIAQSLNTFVTTGRKKLQGQCLKVKKNILIAIAIFNISI